MNDAPLSRRTVGFGLALAVACLLNAVIVVVKEKSSAVMQIFKSLTGHHWITHTLIVLLVFVALGSFLASQSPRVNADRLLVLVFSAVAAATAIIAGFYLFAD